MTKKEREARADYEHVKSLYHKAGKAAAGTAKNSPQRREYAVIKREYKRTGTKLGKITGVR